jgi:excisionase family DNA binding protein
MDDAQKPRVERHFRVDQVCELLALSRSYIYYLLSVNELQSITFGKGKGRPRAVRIPESSIERYLKKLRDGN